MAKITNKLTNNILIKRMHVGFARNEITSLRFMKVLCGDLKVVINAILFVDESQDSVLVFKRDATLGELLEGAERCDFTNITFSTSYYGQHLYLNFDIKHRSLVYSIPKLLSPKLKDIRRAIKRAKGSRNFIA